MSVYSDINYLYNFFALGISAHFLVKENRDGLFIRLNFSLLDRIRFYRRVTGVFVQSILKILIRLVKFPNALH